MLISIGRFSLGFIRGCLGLTRRGKIPPPLQAWWRLLPDLRIRAASVTDAEAMRAVHAASFCAAYGWQPDNLRAAVLDAAAEIGTTGSDPKRPWHHLVAEIGGQVVGFIRYCRFSIAHGTVPATFVSMLYVHPEFQRQGIGSELLALCARYHSNTERIILNIAAHAREAALFYRRHGFRPIDRGSLSLADGTIEIDVVYLSIDIVRLASSRSVVQANADIAARAPA